ncbi:MAG: phosphate acyltransferase [Desulfomonilaceae bacterium]|nr:phosphate acyltransferase [Desulfomonilaceae bacterium]
MTQNSIGQRIGALKQSLIDSGYFDPAALTAGAVVRLQKAQRVSKIERALKASREARQDLRKIADFLHHTVVEEVLRMDEAIRDPAHYDELRECMQRLLKIADGFREEKEFVDVYGELLSVYVLCLYRCGSPGRESPVIRMILTNIARRKAIELDHSRLNESFVRVEDAVTLSLISKRYALYLLATRGMRVICRAEIDYRTHGTSPEALALQVTSLLLKQGIRLADISDLVCSGGDLGTLPDGIYVLTKKVRDESWRRLHNSSLNRAALVVWELREMLKQQAEGKSIHASLCSPLSFSTLGSHDVGTLFRKESKELSQRLQGHVKVAPLKSTAALISEIVGIGQDNLNLLVMTLDGLFASVVRKTGPHIIRELAAQEANKALIDFDFDKISNRLEKDGFRIPPHFSLASGEIGTGVREICELIMIARSEKVSESLKQDLISVVDSYARQVAMVLAMASAGKPSQRPHFIAITSMLALDPDFQVLFAKVRNRVDNPSTPMLCVDSLEHEYLTANHLFETYINPAAGDRRLHFTLESRSMSHALQVLGTTHRAGSGFSFASLLTQVKRSIDEGMFSPANLVLVGADNEDALEAVSNAKYEGLLDRVVLIGNPEDIRTALERTKVPLSPGLDPGVEIVPIDPLAVDLEDKKNSMAESFREFMHGNPDFIVMKGGIDTDKLLRQALAIYHAAGNSGEEGSSPSRRIASHTALFVLPGGRFFALSDAAVNPSFSSAEDLVIVVENQVDVVRKVVSADTILKVAIITAVEKETKAIPATLLAGDAADKCERLQEKYGPLVVEGPLSFDLATVPEVAREKNYGGRIMGDANCLTATDINTANVLYKMLSKTMGSLGLMVDNGSIITAGAGTVPIVLTSRGDTAATKFNSILLAMAYTLRGSAKDSRVPDALRRVG